MSGDKDYVLGTHDEEVERLGLQHRVWRPRALDAWKRAGFTTGQTIIDLGSGPGYASIDLAEIVGAHGRVVAIDRSRRFLDALEAMRAARGLSNIDTFEMDLDVSQLPGISAAGMWTRWVFAFVQHPRPLLERAADLLTPGARWVIHEYFDYATWRLAPRCPEQEEFVRAVMKSWRSTGGEPDIALDLHGWLRDSGFMIESLKPIVEVVSRDSYVWEWPRTFLDVGIERLVEIGELTRASADELLAGIRTAMARPGTLMFTPAVLEIVARK